MSDISITSANVVVVSDGVQRLVTAGGTITAGMPVYRDASDSGKWKPSRANGSTTYRCDAIALNSASNGQPLIVCDIPAIINMGTSGMAIGTVYVVSAAAAGGVAPSTDLASTNYVTVLGVAKTTANLQFKPINSGAQKP